MTRVRRSGRPGRRANAASAVAVLALGLALTAAAAPGTATHDTSATAAAVEVELALPAEAPGLPTPTSLTLVEAVGADVRGAGGDRRADARGALAGGSVVTGQDAPLAPLDQAATASVDAPDATAAVVELPDNALATGGVGRLGAHVDDARTDAAASLAELSALTLADVAPPEALDQFEAALDQVLPPLQDAMLAGLEALGPLVDLDPSGGFAEAESTFRLFIGAMPSIAASVPRAPLVEFEGLVATQSTTTAGDVVRATAGVSIERASLLDGLVDVHGLTSSATSTAAVAGGRASAEANPVLARVTAGMGLVGVRVDAEGLGLNLPGFPREVAEQVRDGIEQLDAALDTLLEATGVTVDTVEPASSTSDDGRSARASGGALVVTVQPSGTEAPIVRLRLGATDTAAAVTASAPPPAGDLSADDLPRTGGAGPAGLAGLAVLVAVVLAGRHRVAAT